MQTLHSKKKYKVVTFGDPLKLHNSNTTTSKLIPAASDEHDLPEVIWSTKIESIYDVLPLAINSMHKRLRRNKKMDHLQHLNGTEEIKAAIISNFTQEQLNEIDPGWQIFMIDLSDQGKGAWPTWFITTEIAPLLGWNRLNYVIRAAMSSHRNTGGWIVQMEKTKNLALSFDDYLGTPLNYTSLVTDGKKVLGEGCRSIQHLNLWVREDIVEAIDEYMKEKHHSVMVEAWKTANHDVEGARLGISSSIAQLPRPVDIRTFWNQSVCNQQCAFRNFISETVASMPQRHPKANITVDTNVVGFIHKQGRNQVHPDYIRDMLTTKIIVLAQRDAWEGHFRLYEALLSGALVMTEPQLYFPHGIIAGKNLVVYNSRLELELKILHYLHPENEQERIRIAQRGREVALTRHRTWQQAERLFLNDLEYRSEYGLSNKPWQ